MLINPNDFRLSSRSFLHAIQTPSESSIMPFYLSYHLLSLSLIQLCSFISFSLQAHSKNILVHYLKIHHTSAEMNKSPSNNRPISVAAISDTQSKHNKLPMEGFSGDLLLHTGDLTQHGTKQELHAAIEWLGGLSFKHIVVIAGNHDIGLDKDCRYRSPMSRKAGTYATPEETDELIDLMRRKGIKYLSPESPSCKLQINGRSISIFGLPYSPKYVGKSAFKRSRLIDTWQACEPEDGYDVLLSHSPPRGILDKDRKGTHVGCDHFLAAIQNICPLVAVFGHIKARGHVQWTWEDETCTDFYNASVMKGNGTLSPATFFSL